MTGFAAYMLSLGFFSITMMILLNERMTIFEFVAGFSIGVALCALVKGNR